MVVNLTLAISLYCGGQRDINNVIVCCGGQRDTGHSHCVRGGQRDTDTLAVYVVVSVTLTLSLCTWWSA